MSIELLELAASALGELRDDVVFVGAATVTLWITDPGAAPVRPTIDVDVILEVTSRSDYYDFEQRLRDSARRARSSAAGYTTTAASF